MGIGDQIMATGFARGAKARGKRIAFGDGVKILWDHHSAEIFKGNPNIAVPGSEGDKDIEWIAYYRGERGYNRQVADRFVWNYDWKAKPGELFFTEQEKIFARKLAGKAPYIVIEPNVPTWKLVAPNKRWKAERFVEVDCELRGEGFTTVQFDYGESVVLPGALKIRTPDFRHAAAVLANAALYIGHEGGLHHAAAATGTPSVVLFGGFVPPSVLGYAEHASLTGNSRTACGNLRPCEHCRSAMDSISIAEVLDEAEKRLKVTA